MEVENATMKCRSEMGCGDFALLLAQMVDRARAVAVAGRVTMEDRPGPRQVRANNPIGAELELMEVSPTRLQI